MSWEPADIVEDDPFASNPGTPRGSKGLVAGPYAAIVSDAAVITPEGLEEALQSSARKLEDGQNQQEAEGAEENAAPATATAAAGAGAAAAPATAGPSDNQEENAGPSDDFFEENPDEGGIDDVTFRRQVSGEKVEMEAEAEEVSEAQMDSKTEAEARDKETQLTFGVEARDPSKDVQRLPSEEAQNPLANPVMPPDTKAETGEVTPGLRGAKATVATKASVSAGSPSKAAKKASFPAKRINQELAKRMLSCLLSQGSPEKLLKKFDLISDLHRKISLQELKKFIRSDLRLPESICPGKDIEALVAALDDRDSVSRSLSDNDSVSVEQLTDFIEHFAGAGVTEDVGVGGGGGGGIGGGPALNKKEEEQQKQQHPNPQSRPATRKSFTGLEDSKASHHHHHHHHQSGKARSSLRPGGLPGSRAVPDYPWLGKPPAQRGRLKVMYKGFTAWCSALGFASHADKHMAGKAMESGDMEKFRTAWNDVNKGDIINLLFKAVEDGSSYCDLRTLKQKMMLSIKMNRKGERMVTKEMETNMNEEQAGGAGAIFVFGLPEDATKRELHMLFSSCLGYERIYLGDNNKMTGKPQACIVFSNKSAATKAMLARRGTTITDGAYPLALDLGTDGMLEEFIQMDGVIQHSEDLHRTAMGARMRSPDPRGPGRSRSPDGLRGRSASPPRFGAGSPRGFGSPTRDRAMSSSPPPQTSAGFNGSPRGETGPSPNGLAWGASPGSPFFAGAGSPESMWSPDPEPSPLPTSSKTHIKRKAEMALEKELEKKAGKFSDLESAINNAKLNGIITDEAKRDLDHAEERLARGARRIATRRDTALRERQNVSLSRLLVVLGNYRPPNLCPHEMPGPAMAQHAKYVRVALQAAQICGCDGELVEEACYIVSKVEMRQRLEMRIEECIQGKGNSGDLQAALEDTNEVAADEGLLHRGAYVLAVRQRQETARRGLEAAIDLGGRRGALSAEHWNHTGSIGKKFEGGAVAGGVEYGIGKSIGATDAQGKLRNALQEARAAGLEDEELEPAAEALEKEQRAAAARRLEDAIKKVPLSLDTAALSNAIQEARRRGVKEELVQKGEAVLNKIPASQNRARGLTSPPTWEQEMVKKGANGSRRNSGASAVSGGSVPTGQRSPGNGGMSPPFGQTGHMTAASPVAGNSRRPSGASQVGRAN